MTGRMKSDFGLLRSYGGSFLRCTMMDYGFLPCSLHYLQMSCISFGFVLSEFAMSKSPLERTS